MIKEAFAENFNIIGQKLKKRWQISFRACLPVSPFKYFVWIVECDAAQNCSGHGICGPDGACQCEATFYGDNCISKF